MTEPELRAIMEAVGDVLQQYVAKAVADAQAPLLARLAELERLPLPRDGRDGRDGKDGADGADGADGGAGRDGIDGKDGAAGRDGTNGIDGKDGRDGLDGLGFEDLQLRQSPDDPRIVIAELQRGERRKEWSLRFPVPIYRGFWRADQRYEPGDQVTYGGSQWIARAETSARPDEHTEDGQRDWTLSTKRGRDGKRGPQGEQGPRGERGAQGERASW